MDIFVSWSGDRSRAVAELLVDWVKCVLQSTRPWISTRDIDKGALWFSEISAKLNSTAAGIICLTQENKENPWILFESGALAKGMAASRICTFLVDLEPADIRDPLAQFNHTTPDAVGLYNLAKTLNRSLGEHGLAENILKRAFEAYWGQFESDFNRVIAEFPLKEKSKPRSDKDILSEILETTRSLNSRLRKVEMVSMSDSSKRRTGEIWPRDLSADLNNKDSTDPDTLFIRIDDFLKRYKASQTASEKKYSITDIIDKEKDPK